MMSVEPVSVEVGSSATASDANKAYEQLQGLVAKQRALAPTLSDTDLYEMVFAANPELVSASVWPLQRQNDSVSWRINFGWLGNALRIWVAVVCPLSPPNQFPEAFRLSLWRRLVMSAAKPTNRDSRCEGGPLGQ